MSASKHTPGKVDLVKLAEEKGAELNAKHQAVAAEANARWKAEEGKRLALIAAAPELAEALRAFVAHHDRHVEGQCHCERCTPARAALKKAGFEP